MKFETSVLEYLGKLENGILVLLSIIYDNKYYEATYFYTDEQLLLTVESDLIDYIGHKIEEDEDYIELIKDIIKKVSSHNELINSIEDIDFSRWFNIEGDYVCPNCDIVFTDVEEFSKHIETEHPGILI